MTAAALPDHAELVTLLYRVLLNREPDREGFENATKWLRDGSTSPQQLARSMAASPELLGADAGYRDQLVKTFAALGTDAGSGLLDREAASVAAHGCEFVIPPGTSFHAELTSPGGYEPWVLPYFLELCRPGMNVLDIGASWGAFALPAAKRIGPSGRVYAIEVSAANCGALLRSARASDIANVDILPVGVSDKLGSELLRRQALDNNNTIDGKLNVYTGNFSYYDVVAVIPIDMLASGWPSIDIMKIDIEGMEYKAMVGARGFLQKSRPIVFCEYSPVYQKQGSGVEGAALLDLMTDAGFETEVLHRHRPREMVSRGDGRSVADQVDTIWRQHVDDDGGSHLDLCFHPRTHLPLDAR